MKYSFPVNYAASLQAEQGATNLRTAVFYPGNNGPQAAMIGAQTNDIIEVNPTTYTNFAITLPTTLTVRSPDPTKKYTFDVGVPGNRAIELGMGIGGTFEDGEICNNKVEWGNAAGFWPTGGAYVLTLRRMLLHDLCNGVLAGDHRDATILIEDTEAYDCGDYNGFGHNFYIGAVKLATINRIFSHMKKNRGDPGVANWQISWGNLLKMRAQESNVNNSQLLQDNGESNRPCDLPNGGKVTVAGNTMSLNAQTMNNHGYGQIMSYGVEEEADLSILNLPIDELHITNNTFINSGGPLKQFLFIKNIAPTVYVNIGNTYKGFTRPCVEGDAIYEPSSTNNTFS